MVLVDHLVSKVPIGFGEHAEDKGIAMLLSKRRYPMNHPKQLIDKKALVKLVQYSPQHIARLEKAGQFPKRLRLGQNRVAWLLSEVEDWIDG